MRPGPQNLAVIVGLMVATACAPRPLGVETGRARAQERGVPMLLDFYTDWCANCRTFSNAYESAGELRAAIDGGAVLVKVNAEEGGGVDLAERFGVDSYPTFIVTTDRLETVQRWSGYGWATDFLRNFSAAVADPVPIAERAARYEARPTAADAVALGRYYLALEEHEEALAYLGAAADRGAPEADYAYDLFMVRYEGRDDGLAEVEEIVASADAALASAGTDAGRKVSIGLLMVNLAGEEVALDVGPYVAAAYAATEGSDESFMATARQELEIAHALHIERDPQRALDLKVAGLHEGWEEDASALDEVAWWCFRSRVDLERAEELARQGLDLAEEGPQRASLLDTLAEILLARGEPAEAVALIKQAVQEDPDSEYYKQQLVRFQLENAPIL